MASKATPTPNVNVDPMAHVEMILDAEGPSPRQTTTIPTVMEQSKKLSEMMDGIADPSEFGTLHNEIEAEMAKIATVGTESERSKGTNPEPVKLPPFRPDSPRQAAPKAPKEAPVHEYEARTPGRRRSRGGGGSTQAPVILPTATPSGGTTQLNGEHVASLLKMTHAIGATVLGPSFAISDESARAIGDAALPVLEDFGVAVASRAVHLLMLVSTVAMIEGPIMLTVYGDMKARAEAQRSGFSTMAMGGGMHNAFEGADPDEVANAVSRATGVMVGNAS